MALCRNDQTRPVSGKIKGCGRADSPQSAQQYITLILFHTVNAVVYSEGLQLFYKCTAVSDRNMFTESFTAVFCNPYHAFRRSVDINNRYSCKSKFTAQGAAQRTGIEHGIICFLPRIRIHSQSPADKYQPYGTDGTVLFQHTGQFQYQFCISFRLLHLQRGILLNILCAQQQSGAAVFSHHIIYKPGICKLRLHMRKFSADAA